MPKKILTKKGFTLIELIVVIAILAILAAILIPSITNYITKANEARDQSDARSYYSVLALEVATNSDDWADDDYNQDDAIPTPEHCDTLAFSVLGGAITSYDCTIGTNTFSDPDFKPVPVP